MQPVAIRTDQLTRSFGDVVAINRVSLDVPGGIVFGFLGPNAAGKTTTFRLLLGLLEPSGGRAEVLGFDTRHRAESSLQHAQQRLSLSSILLFLLPLLGAQVVPADLRAQILSLLASTDPTRWLILVVLLLLVIDAGLILASLARFQRARLILD
ncbi:MAG: ATP-binding cassette domain-containing protein [Chloroflexota bacterium]